MAKPLPMNRLLDPRRTRGNWTGLAGRMPKQTRIYLEAIAQTRATASEKTVTNFLEDIRRLGRT
jgi:hypothetical protein